MKIRHFMGMAALMPVVFLLSVTGIAGAQNRGGTVNVTPYLGAYVPDSSLDIDSGIAWGLGVGLNFSEKAGVEFTFNAADSEMDGDDAQVFLYRLDLVHHLTGRLPERIVPYVSAGLGMQTINSDQRGFDKDSDILFDTGVGLKYFITRDLALRGDLRYLLDFANDGLCHNFLAGAGLTLQMGFGERPSEIAVPVELMPPVTAQAPVVIEEKAPCPDAPPGCTERDWCQKDADADGVPDCLDKCPDTPKGTTVEASGCPPASQQGAIIFRNILFAFNKADLMAESLPVLDQVVEYLLANPGVNMEIQGHTDNVGTPGYNLRLSERRAASVQQYLTGRGVPAERLRTKGFGLTRPIAPGNTDEDRARNRRVEFSPF
ncbi:MAG TPA: OmpA family protein [Deltaproteobacteria bacterium]|nr:OmpA family protein [Deltaproteobacteria bacterium]